jgi:hypothetical protein
MDQRLCKEMGFRNFGLWMEADNRRQFSVRSSMTSWEDVVCCFAKWRGSTWVMDVAKEAEQSMEHNRLDTCGISFHVHWGLR